MTVRDDQAHDELTFGADVEETAAEGDANGEASQYEGIAATIVSETCNAG